MTDFEKELEANGGHTGECEGSCHPRCPIGQERRAEANRRAAEAQRAWSNAFDDGHLHDAALCRDCNPNATGAWGHVR